LQFKGVLLIFQGCFYRALLSFILLVIPDPLSKVIADVDLKKKYTQLFKHLEWVDSKSRRKPVFLCVIDSFPTPHKFQPIEKIENLKQGIHKIRPK
jgi:hypothetical protein